MNVTNQNPENDSFRFKENEDGTCTIEWDPNDPNWNWMNQLTSKEIELIIKEAIQDEIKKK